MSENPIPIPDQMRVHCSQIVPIHFTLEYKDNIHGLTVNVAFVSLFMFQFAMYHKCWHMKKLARKKHDSVFCLVLFFALLM